MAADLSEARPTVARDDENDRRRERLRTAMPWLLALTLFVLYAALAVRDQQRMITTGYDLGIFDQAVRAYAHGHLPITTLKGSDYNLLGDHFSPIIATIAPFYLLWPSVYTLLLAQAALLAVAVVPLSRWATAELGARAGLAVGVIYGLSWGIASAAGFDFHEVAFGVPLLAFSATALGQNRPRAALLWALPLLLVKEDLGFTVAVVGVLAATRGAKRLGWAVALLGIAGSVLEMKVLIPAVNPAGYAYTSTLFTGGPAHAGLISHLFYDATHLFIPHVKIITIIQLLAPTAFLAVRSRLIWLVVPTLAWRFLSADMVYWGTMFQYSAVLMPIVTAVLFPRYPVARVFLPSTWSTPSRVGVARSVMQLIPDDATVSASNTLIPQLTDRTTVYLFDPTTLGSVAWIFLDTQSDNVYPELTPAGFAQAIKTAEHSGFHVVENLDGYLLLHR